LGIWFGNGKNDMKIGKEVDVVYTIDSNYWNGESKLQLKIKDVGKT